MATTLQAQGAVKIRVGSGNTQSAYAGSPLPAPLVARVTDSTGSPIAGASVTFSDGGVGGTFSAGTVTTDSLGKASTVYTTPPVAKVITISATTGSASTKFSESAQIPPALMSLSIARQNFGPTTFGINVWPSFTFGSLRLWDTGTGWPDVAPSPGVYNWEVLNGWLTQAQAHGVTDIMYTFGSTPTWASGNSTDTSCKYGPGTCYPPTDVNADGTGTDQMWIDFVTALVQLCKGRIKYYQLWDTPHDTHHWVGTPQQLVRMSADAYNIIKSLDPSALVLAPPSGAYHVAVSSPCVTANKEEVFYLAGGGPYTDLNSYNSYFGTQPEDVIAAFQCLQTMLAKYGQTAKPIWDSEGSWGTQTDLPDSTLQAAYVARAYLIQLSLGVSRFYWYSYNHSWGTLWDKFTGMHVAGKAYIQVSQWLVGAVPTQKCASTNGVWSCVFTRAGGYQAQASWVTGASQSYTPPSRYTSYRDLLGNRTAITSGQAITLTTQPILLE